MPDFHAGDLVIIRDREYLSAHRDDWPTCVSYMREKAGMEYIIAKVEHYSCFDYEGYLYRLQGMSDCVWRPDWLEPVISLDADEVSVMIDNMF